MASAIVKKVFGLKMETLTSAVILLLLTGIATTDLWMIGLSVFVSMMIIEKAATE